MNEYDKTDYPINAAGSVKKRTPLEELVSRMDRLQGIAASTFGELSSLETKLNGPKPESNPDGKAADDDPMGLLQRLAHRMNVLENILERIRSSVERLREDL